MRLLCLVICFAGLLADPALAEAPASPERWDRFVAGNSVSRELTAQTQWGREPIAYATPAIGSGTSGGPVFIAADQEGDLAIVGMHVGVEADETGGKLSKLVPARIIRSAIESHPIASDESAAPTLQLSKPGSESNG